MILKMKTLYSFKTLVSIYQSIKVDIPKERNFHNTVMGSPNVTKKIIFILNLMVKYNELIDLAANILNGGITMCLEIN